MESKFSFVLIAVFVTLGCLLLFQQRAMGKQRSEAGAKGPVVDLQQPGDSVTISLGDAVRYTGTEHRSVGTTYWMEYDPEAFRVEWKKVYEQPAKARRGEEGSDRAQLIHTLHSLKRGEFTVRAIHDFRGDTASVATYHIEVK